MKPSCCWNCSLSFKCKEEPSRQAQQKVSQGKSLPPRGKGMALGCLNLLVGLWYSTNGFIELHHGDVGPVLPSGDVILNHEPVAQSDISPVQPCICSFVGELAVLPAERLATGQGCVCW